MAWPATMRCERSVGAVSGMSSCLARSMSPQCLGHEVFYCLTQQDIARFARDAFAPDLQHHRNGERGEAVENNMPVSAFYSPKKITEPIDVDQAGRGVGEGRLQQN